MANNQGRIDQLFDKLEVLQRKQEDFSREISELRAELDQLKSGQSREVVHVPDKQHAAVPITVKEEKIPVKRGPSSENAGPEGIKGGKPKAKSDLEKFIGENLINKIGIIITVLGVAIGAKYSIDNELISPFTRIILGYLAGIGLLVFALVLKSKYENFSAVLLSGAMAIMYLMTYLAYSFFGFIPQLVAFGLMVIFTAFTVLAAINYNRQVIAHIGLVGAYAVPFLLSDGSGKVANLFAYMTIVNAGVFTIAFKKYWKPLHYSSFGFTWLIYTGWFVFKYETSEHFAMGLFFLAVFFLTFYLMFLVNNLLRNSKLEKGSVILLLANTFIFYGMGYAILDRHETGGYLLGLFTLGNALIHSVASAIIYRRKLVSHDLLYLVSGLVLVFITVAIPVQLDGNWVTLLWAGEAVLLFWIGRTKGFGVYEKLSYPLMVLAFFSILEDWSIIYHNGYDPDVPETRTTLFFNPYFLSTMLFVIAFSVINFIDRKKEFPRVKLANGLTKIVSFGIPAILLIILYYGVRLELENYWEQLYQDSLISIPVDHTNDHRSFWDIDLRRFSLIWTINYSILFFTVLAFVNIKRVKNQSLGLASLAFMTLALLVFLTQGLFVLSELRESYLDQTLSEYYTRGVFNVVIRYVSFLFVGLMLMVLHRTIRQPYIGYNLLLAFEVVLHVSILWVVSSELINWMDIADSSQSYKLGLSILWGVYSLALIGWGIMKKQKHLRIGAISLFGVTLVKLFFYDISHLDTLAKIIVFVSLGVLLLIISFLYNKYKHLISDETES